MEVVVIGGGCYGTYHARQLLKACHAGRLRADRVLVVDHKAECRAARELGGDPLLSVVASDWDSFLQGYLVETHRDSSIVPAPFSPHLFYNWLASALTAAFGDGSVMQEPAATPLDLPFERLLPNGQRALSFASWVCPATCIEPAVCPATKGPRDWSLAAAVERFARDPSSGLSGSAVFTSYHLAYGVTAVAVSALLGAKERLTAPLASSRRRLAIATVSHCHGLMGILSLSASATRLGRKDPLWR